MTLNKATVSKHTHISSSSGQMNRTSVGRSEKLKLKLLMLCVAQGGTQ